MAGEKMGHVYSLTKNKTEEGILFFDEKWGHYCFLNEKGGSNFFHNIFDIFYICILLQRKLPQFAIIENAVSGVSGTSYFHAYSRDPHMRHPTPTPTSALSKL